MDIPQSWIDEIVSKLKMNKSLFKAFSSTKEMLDEEYYIVVRKFINSEFNINWSFDPRLSDKFKNFFISIATHQCLLNMHPLTCSSNHENLVPRIDYKGNCYLVCPTCGNIQQHDITPVLF